VADLQRADLDEAERDRWTGATPGSPPADLRREAVASGGATIIDEAERDRWTGAAPGSHPADLRREAVASDGAAIIDEAVASGGATIIEELVRDHEAWRARCINLIASENVLSPAVRAQLVTDLAGRYGDYTGRDAAHRKYFGTPYVVEIEQRVADLACRLFGARYCELRPLSGHIAGAGVLMGLCKPGDRVLEVGGDGGGHRMAAKLAESPMIDLDVQFLPFDTARWNVDVPATLEMISALRPRIVILGSSTFLFPHPVREIAAAVHAVDGLLVYDASHVFGLLAAGHFQQPLAEGADVIYGSTHKTLFGPQGGLILSNDEALMAAISGAIYPALVTNHHLQRIPALGLALLELETWGAAYATAVIANARRLAHELATRGLPVAGAADGYTQSHTLLVGTHPYAGAEEAGRRLEQVGIIVTAARLPAALGRAGLRLGTQEITRRGAHAQDMPDLAALLIEALNAEAPREQLARRIETWVATRLGPCRYTWDGTEAASDHTLLARAGSDAGAPA
jgi:glycine hydroxymethyltransferase